MSASACSCAHRNLASGSVPALRFAHRPQLPALRALLTEGRPLAQDDATTQAALYHRLEGFAVRADPGSPLRAAHRRSTMASALVRAQLGDAAPVIARAT